MSNQLVIAAIGEDRPGLVDSLAGWILDSGCNIADSRMTVLGGEFAVLLLIEGQWNSLAKLEEQTGKSIRLQPESLYTQDQFDVVLM